MGLIIDTHIYTALLFEPQKLTHKTINLLSENKDLFVCLPVIWEVSNHIVKGLYDIKDLELSLFLEPFHKAYNIQVLPTTWEVLNWVTIQPLVTAHGKLHKDSFDRLIIAHSIVFDIPIISKDRSFPFYSPLGLKWIEA